MFGLHWLRNEPVQNTPTPFHHWIFVQNRCEKDTSLCFHQIFAFVVEMKSNDDNNAVKIVYMLMMLKTIFIPRVSVW